ncbi:hypothetical protein Taro_047803 [Colocasia esculenta]|uniref:Uncharacterized protein n=1 Tax=Colocasia esculenta TaxID=4460 RepID=A0A843X1J2_COLES|nr:hypothetical protein [Colocasia esculenta]
MGRLGAIRTLTSGRPILPLFHLYCSWLFCFGLLLLGGAAGVASSTALAIISASARTATVPASNLVSTVLEGGTSGYVCGETNLGGILLLRL